MNNGFTMLELIFIIVILSILATLVIPNLPEKVDSAQIENNSVRPDTSKDFSHIIYTSPTK